MSNPDAIYDPAMPSRCGDVAECHSDDHINCDGTYAAIYRDRQVGIVSGTTANQMLATSDDPANLRFERLS